MGYAEGNVYACENSDIRDGKSLSMRRRHRIAIKPNKLRRPPPKNEEKKQNFVLVIHSKILVTHDRIQYNIRLLYGWQTAAIVRYKIEK